MKKSRGQLVGIASMDSQSDSKIRGRLAKSLHEFDTSANACKEYVKFQATLASGALSFFDASSHGFRKTIEILLNRQKLDATIA